MPGASTAFGDPAIKKLDENITAKSAEALTGELLRLSAYSASREQAKRAQALIAEGADVNGADSNGNRPLHLAAWKGSNRLIDVLLTNKAKLNVKNKKGESPLFLAIEGHGCNTVNFLVERGADVHATDNLGESPVKRARAVGDKSVEAYLATALKESHLSEIPESELVKRRTALDKTSSLLDKELARRQEQNSKRSV